MVIGQLHCHDTHRTLIVYQLSTPCRKFKLVTLVVKKCLTDSLALKILVYGGAHLALHLKIS